MKSEWVFLFRPRADNKIRLPEPNMWIRVRDSEGKPLKVSRSYLRSLREDGIAGTENIPKECLV